VFLWSKAGSKLGYKFENFEKAVRVDFGKVDSLPSNVYHAINSGWLGSRGPALSGSRKVRTP